MLNKRLLVHSLGNQAITGKRKTKVTPAMVYTLDTKNPKTTYYGDFYKKVEEDRWYRATATIYLADPEEDETSDKIEVIKVVLKHASPYKTNITEYGRQLQNAINEIISEGEYYPEQSIVRVTMGSGPQETTISRTKENKE